MASAELRGEQRVGKAGAGRCLQMVKRALPLEGLRRQSRATGLGPSTRKSSQGGEDKAVGEKQRTDIGTCPQSFPRVLSDSIGPKFFVTQGKSTSDFRLEASAGGIEGAWRRRWGGWELGRQPAESRP